MKILVLIDAWFPFVGGAQIQIVNLKKILEKKYHCQYYILHSPSSNILIRFLWALWVIPQAILWHSKYHFDLIHAHAFWAGIPGKILSKIIKIPLIFTAHGTHLMDIKQKGLKAFLEKIILTKIKYDQVISVNSSFLKYKNINRKIKIIPNGVDIQSFTKIKVNKEKPFKILFVGRRDSFKGLIFLNKAMAIVKREFPNARLRIVSNIYDYQKIIEEYKSSHLFVLPSLAEGQPISLLEAWAAKLPVVVTDVGENTKMVRDGYNGYLVKPKDPQALSLAIITILKNKKRYLMGERGYSLVKNNYTWEQCVQKTYAIYKKTYEK